MNWIGRQYSVISVKPLQCAIETRNAQTNKLYATKYSFLCRNFEIIHTHVLKSDFIIYIVCTHRARDWERSMQKRQEKQTRALLSQYTIIFDSWYRLWLETVKYMCREWTATAHKTNERESILWISHKFYHEDTMATIFFSSSSLSLTLFWFQIKIFNTIPS